MNPHAPFAKAHRHQTCTSETDAGRPGLKERSRMRLTRQPQPDLPLSVNHRSWQKGAKSCDIIRSISGSCSRGPLKKLALVGAFLVFIFQAQTSQLAFIVLNTGNWASGRLPSDWMINVHHGKPDVSVCDDGPSCLHFKS